MERGRSLAGPGRPAAHRPRPAAGPRRRRPIGTVDAVVSSDLERARVTAEIIAGRLGVEPVLIEPGLRERDAGEFSGPHPRRDPRAVPRLPGRRPGRPRARRRRRSRWTAGLGGRRRPVGAYRAGARGARPAGPRRRRRRRHPRRRDLRRRAGSRCNPARAGSPTSTDGG